MLLARLLFQVKVLESDVLVVHEFALSPLAEAVLIILALVASEVVLDCACLFEGEFVETELKVYQVLVDTCGLQPFGTASLIHLAVGEVERQKGRIQLHALNEEEHLWDGGFPGLRVKGGILVLVDVVALEVEDSQSGILLQSKAEGLDGLRSKLVSL